jgi:hypothetical protein
VCYRVCTGAYLYPAGGELRVWLGTAWARVGQVAT